MVYILAHREYLANSEWTKPYILSLILVAIRFLMFGLSVFGSLLVWVHVLKVQARYIRALIRLEIPPEQNTKDESSVPQEFPASAPLASTPPASVPATNSQKPALQFPMPPTISRPVLEKLAQTAAFQQTGPKTPPESRWETLPQRPQLESFDQKRAKNIPKRHIPTPVFPLKAPGIDCTHPVTTAQQPTSTTSQQGSQTTPPHLSYNSLTGNAPPSCTDSTTNRANDISVRDEAFNALFRQFKASAKSRQDQGAFNTTPASSPTGRVPVGQAFEENAWKPSGFPAQSADWEHVYHEEGESGSQ
ncbi:uncharacterized protein BKA55DRAFT_561518 [Fusarium redolens]|uniref:Uncharacterized protein n=1 Tax=Fusarium redolens TaxID=48865 RepID=A0A9P9KLB2_FUSRE|nr:uncharacterized protein BKA55DRAFT_561518 [Fusarium redolens]KAH7261510.1 hypothetical protein BKA55DRAFT_561518 [Fusarium redolens]